MKLKLFLIISAILLAVTSPWTVRHIISRDHIVAKIDSKESKFDSKEKTSKYLVYTDVEVFENVDEPMSFKWSSSDYQGALKVGKTYRLTVKGYRVPFFSWYRNIVDYELVPDSTNLTLR